MPRWRPEGGCDGLRVTFPFSEAYRAADAVARGTVAPRTTQETARKQPEGGNPSRGLADRILAFLRENPSASCRKIAEALAGTTEGSVRYQLDKLKESNRLRRVGPDRGGRWMVLDGDDPAGGSASKARSGSRRDPGDGALHHNRQKTARNGGQPPENHQKPGGTARKQPEPLPIPDRILAILRQNPSTSRRELAAALDTTQATVRYHLDKLRAAGKIERMGPDKGGHWKVLDVVDTEAGPGPVTPIRVFISSVDPGTPRHCPEDCPDYPEDYPSTQPRENPGLPEGRTRAGVAPLRRTPFHLGEPRR